MFYEIANCEQTRTKPIYHIPDLWISEESIRKETEAEADQRGLSVSIL